MQCGFFKRKRSWKTENDHDGDNASDIRYDREGAHGDNDCDEVGDNDCEKERNGDCGKEDDNDCDKEDGSDCAKEGDSDCGKDGDNEGGDTREGAKDMEDIAVENWWSLVLGMSSVHCIVIHILASSF